MCGELRLVFVNPVICFQQVALDRAAHLMDAVAFGHQGWDGVREELAEASSL